MKGKTELETLRQPASDPEEANVCTCVCVCECVCVCMCVLCVCMCVCCVCVCMCASLHQQEVKPVLSTIYTEQ